MLHVALLDDHPAVLAGLRRLIDSQPDLAVVAAAPTAAELALQLDGTRPDVLVVDYDLARGNGLAHCRRIKNRRRPPAVLIYSAYASAALTLAARAAQADGVVDKTEPVRAVLTAIRRVADGEKAMPAIPRDAYDAAVARIHDTDLPVLSMLLDGEPLEAIAEALRADRAEVAWRAERIVGRLRPRVSGVIARPEMAAPPHMAPPAPTPCSGHAANATPDQPHGPGPGRHEPARRERDADDAGEAGDHTPPRRRR